MIWFCVKFIWPHINKAIEERQMKIADGLNAAERAHAELKDADAKVADEIARPVSRPPRSSTRRSSRPTRSSTRPAPKRSSEINRQKASAQDDIASMAQRAREQLREQVGALAVQGASKIVQREIDPAAHKALLDQLATEI